MHAYDHAWCEPLIKNQSATDLAICDPNVFGGGQSWPCCRVSTSATDDAVFARVVAGFDQCARPCAVSSSRSSSPSLVYLLSLLSSLFPLLISTLLVAICLVRFVFPRPWTPLLPLPRTKSRTTISRRHPYYLVGSQFAGVAARTSACTTHGPSACSRRP